MKILNQFLFILKKQHSYQMFCRNIIFLIFYFSFDRLRSNISYFIVQCLLSIIFYLLRVFKFLFLNNLSFKITSNTKLYNIYKRESLICFSQSVLIKKMLNRSKLYFDWVPKYFLFIYG